MSHKKLKIVFVFIWLLFYLPGIYLIVDFNQTDQLLYGIILVVGGIINHKIALEHKAIINLLVKYL